MEEQGIKLDYSNVKLLTRLTLNYLLHPSVSAISVFRLSRPKKLWKNGRHSIRVPSRNNDLKNSLQMFLIIHPKFYTRSSIDLTIPLSK